MLEPAEAVLGRHAAQHLAHGIIEASLGPGFGSTETLLELREQNRLSSYALEFCYNSVVTANCRRKEEWIKIHAASLLVRALRQTVSGG
jgi:hypothetical protein